MDKILVAEGSELCKKNFGYYRIHDTRRCHYIQFGHQLLARIFLSTPNNFLLTNKNPLKKYFYDF